MLPLDGNIRGKCGKVVYNVSGCGTYGIAGCVTHFGVQNFIEQGLKPVRSQKPRRLFVI